MTATATPGADRAFAVDTLPRVSRTFALCIRLLPPDLEHAVRIAYLLCRIADTIEDSIALDAADKRRCLVAFGGVVRDPAGPAEAVDTRFLQAAFAATPGDEPLLAREADRVLREFRRLTEAERKAIAPWVVEMCEGMATFCRDRADGGELPTLDTVADLDRYCYYVAGTVGHLLTELFGLQLGDDARKARLDADATSFGLGLQLTNIIKDAAEDHRRGWSFIPRDLCRDAGVDPDTLFRPEHRDAARRVFGALIAKARGHLQDALVYSTLLPRSQYRIRLFCLTSLFFAVRTLRQAAEGTGLVAGGTIKISRGDVYRTLATTCAVAPSNRLVRAYYRALGGRTFAEAAE